MKPLLPLIILSLSFIISSCSGSKKSKPAPDDNDIAIGVRNITDHGPYFSLTFQALSKDQLPLTGLENAAFSIKENGVEISENTFVPKPNPKEFNLDILLLLDFSGSVTDTCDDIVYSDGQYIGPEENYEHVKCYQVVKNSIAFAQKMLDTAKVPNLSISVYYLNGKRDITKLIARTSNSNDIKNAIIQVYSTEWREREELRVYRSTNLYGGIEQALGITCSYIDNCHSREATFSSGDNGGYKTSSVVIFTDGKEEAFYQGQNNSVKSMRNSMKTNSSQYIYTVGLGGAADKDILQEIGRNGFYFAEKNENLGEAFDNVIDNLKRLAESHYIVKFCTAAQVDEIKVEVNVTTKDDLKSKFSFLVNLGLVGDRRCELPREIAPPVTLPVDETLAEEEEITPLPEVPGPVQEVPGPVQEEPGPVQEEPTLTEEEQSILDLNQLMADQTSLQEKIWNNYYDISNNAPDSRYHEFLEDMTKFLKNTLSFMDKRDESDILYQIYYGFMNEQWIHVQTRSEHYIDLFKDADAKYLNLLDIYGQVQLSYYSAIHSDVANLKSSLETLLAEKYSSLIEASFLIVKDSTSKKVYLRKYLEYIALINGFSTYIDVKTYRSNLNTLYLLFVKEYSQFGNIALIKEYIQVLYNQFWTN